MLDNLSLEVVQQLLREENDSLSELINLLEQENNILASGTPDDLYDLLPIKDKTVSKLESIMEKRSELFRDIPGSFKETLEELAEQNPEFEKCISLFEENTTLMIKCQDKNITNGCVINHTYHQTQRLMQAVMGTAVSQTYTKEGSNKTDTSGQTIGKA